MRHEDTEVHRGNASINNTALVQIFDHASSIEVLRQLRPVVLIAEVGSAAHGSKPFQSLDNLKKWLDDLLPHGMGSKSDPGDTKAEPQPLEDLLQIRNYWKPTICVLVDPHSAANGQGSEDQSQFSSRTEKEFESMKVLTESHGVRFIQKGLNEGDISSLYELQACVQSGLIKTSRNLSSAPDTTVSPGGETAKDRWRKFANVGDWRGEASKNPLMFPFSPDKQIWEVKEPTVHPLDQLFSWYVETDGNQPPKGSPVKVTKVAM